MKNTTKAGLRELPKDKKDFSFTKTFGKIDIETIPDDFSVGRIIEIKNQGNSDLCTSFAGCAISELQERELLSPEFQFMLTKRIQGDWKSWGADLRTACKSFLEGSLPQSDNVYPLKEYGRDFVANPDNWKDLFLLENKAEKYKKQSYFNIDL